MISKIKFINDKVLTNNELCFVDPSTQKPYEIVVLAGENGSYKTTILNRIASFVYNNTYQKNDWKPTSESFEIANVEFENKHFRLYRDRYAGYSVDMSNLSSKNEWYDFLNSIIYSQANINFECKNITTVGNKTVDDEKNIIMETSKHSTRMGKQPFSSNNSIELQELLIDLFNQDGREVLNKQSQGVPYEIISKNLKINRFKNAFNHFFELNGSSLRFQTIDGEGNNYKIMFTKDGNSVQLSDLSSGEQQIVFRATFLLKDINLFKSPIVLIDEPEISLHPKWQKNIISFYYELFKDKNAQLIITTHSPYILQSVFSLKYSCILRYKNSVKWYELVDKNTSILKLKNCSIAEINNLIFDIESVEFLDLLCAKINDNGWLNEKKQIIHIHFDETNGSSVGFQTLPAVETVSTKKGKNYQYRTFVCFVRNYFHHPENIEQLNKFISKHSLGNINILLHNAINECKKIIKKYDI